MKISSHPNPAVSTPAKNQQEQKPYTHLSFNPYTHNRLQIRNRQETESRQKEELRQGRGEGKAKERGYLARQ